VSGRSTLAGFALALAGALLLALAATAPAQDPGPAYDDWNSEQPGYPSNAPISPRAECANGSDRCIERTIGEMWRRFHTVVPSCQDNAVFSLTYLRVTEDIARGVDEGYYDDPRWLNELDALFARPYFLTYDNWEAGRTELVPPAWRIAFDAGRDGTVKGIGNLLLSMNAHVNRDFPFVLYQSGLVQPDGDSRKADHDAGNARLRALYRPMIDELTARFDPSIDDYDVPGTEADDEALFSVLVGWREGAWQNAQLLANASSDAERRQIGQAIEAEAVAQALTIFAGSAYAPGETRDAREAQCAANGGQRKDYRRGADVAHFASRTTEMNSKERIHVPIRCPDGPGPCVGAATVEGASGKLRFFVSAGRRADLRVRAPAGIGNGDRVRVRLRSLLGPGVDYVKERTLRVEAG